MDSRTIKVVAALSRKIDATIWVDPAAPPDIPLAPLTRDHVLPLASAGRGVENA